MAATKKQATMRAQWLGQGLRKLRERNNLTMAEVGAYLQRDGATVSRFETGVYPARMPDVLALLDLYGINDPKLRQFLLNLSRDVVEPGWWDQFRDDAETSLIDMAWLEARALRISSYHQMVVPGLIQTAEYAEAAIRAADWNASEEQIRRWRDLRINRQQVLAKDKPLKLTAILDEAVLRRVVGGPEVMRAQLQHLVELTKKSTVDIHVLPFTVGAHASPDSSFYICEMAEPFQPVGYIDTLGGALYVEVESVDRFKLAFDRLRELTLDRPGSVALIEAAAKDLE